MNHPSPAHKITKKNSLLKCRILFKYYLSHHTFKYAEGPIRAGLIRNLKITLSLSKTTQQLQSTSSNVSLHVKRVARFLNLIFNEAYASLNTYA